MGKPARPRTLSESQARAVGRNIRVSPRKLNLVAQSIRGKSAESALATLTFTPKRIANDVKKILQSAIANAENNHDLDVDDLIVSEASVGKNLTMKRFHARARGRSGRIEKPFSQITIVVEEKRMLEATKKVAAKKSAKSAPPKSKDTKPAIAKAETQSTDKAPAAKKTAAKKSPAKKAGRAKPVAKAESKSTKSQGNNKKSGKAKEAE
jgi:large subunit ribosomal protein L22